ncbi:hypothetical protein K469DRAFT_310524 [Zopfia rhizophila CBS 207.26]|uniref:Prion-inhibition and propagation HeLo domain-containing protein n=1 Tax=Zopfia rhizophila CBS 207.26 TaxID=1314779 RepID=A0A6A6ELB4_9PEZI|nr:hypothetical protein K469DRAFT_310524 [Zopfia rhizophila CBS 207.26]
MIEGSVICSPWFESSPLVQFQTRFSEYRKKAGLANRTRWAIRDSKKFTGLVQDLKDLLDGLGQITVSPRTTILKGELIRQETQSIPNLNILNIIESTCSDADWKNSASVASIYLNEQNRLTSAKRKAIHEWMDIDHVRETPGELPEEQYRGQIARGIDRSRYRSLDLLTSYYQPPKISGMDGHRLKSLGKYNPIMDMSMGRLLAQTIPMRIP